MGMLVALLSQIISLAIFVAVIFFIVKFAKKFFKGFGIPNFSELAKFSQDEKICFQNMMMTPCDDTVSAYIEVMKRGAAISASHSASQDIGTGMQMKYINAYNEIKKCENVSAELKDELARMFLVMGVAVKTD